MYIYVIYTYIYIDRERERLLYNELIIVLIIIVARVPGVARGREGARPLGGTTCLVLLV